jgi:hypothetical protein
MGATSQSAVVRFLTSTSVWGLVVLVLGASSVLMPWRFSALLPAFAPEWQGLPGTATWHGIVAAAIYGVAALILLATFSTEWVPAWKPVLLALAGIAGGACCVAYATMSDEALIEVFNRRMPPHATVTEIVPGYHMLAYGFNIAMGCAIALLVLSAIQVRGIVFGRAEIPAGGPTKVEPVTAQNGEVPSHNVVKS